ncbi:MAG: hypothetical protein PWR29_1094 [Methanolobus sp.]|jgi:uncharacterized membrane protein YcaP (DUF421 family)|nr:hypothetical protein [Methanolobus sp.]MDN5309859.1 hypothetical protein [Methanolobus sp.]
MLVGLQFAVTWMTSRSDSIKKAVKNEPRLLYYKGGYTIKDMRKMRIVKEEIEQAIRSTGQSSVDDVEAAIIETNGNRSVIRKGSKAEKYVIEVVLKKE